MPTPRAIAVSLAILLQAIPLAATAQASDSGRTVYQSVCRSCHDPRNVMVSSPKAGDVAGWQRRLAKGLEKITDNAVTGIGAMPPNGGAAGLSRQQIREAILYMAAPGK